MNVVDPHAPGGTKHIDRGSVKRKYDEMAEVYGLQCTYMYKLTEYLSLSLSSPSFPSLQGTETGNYTLETAKSRLHLFLQQTRQPKDMQIRPVGPDHNRYNV